jgi:chorismate mutase
MAARAAIGKCVAETKYASNVTTFTDLIKKKDASTIRTLLTNKTQEAGVLAQAKTAADALGNAWIASGGIVDPGFVGKVENAAALVFEELIEITTEYEIKYILARLD